MIKSEMINGIILSVLADEVMLECRQIEALAWLFDERRTALWAEEQEAKKCESSDS